MTSAAARMFAICVCSIFSSTPRAWASHWCASMGVPFSNGSTSCEGAERQDEHDAEPRERTEEIPGEDADPPSAGGGAQRGIHDRVPGQRDDQGDAEGRPGQSGEEAADD